MTDKLEPVHHAPGLRLYGHRGKDIGIPAEAVAKMLNAAVEKGTGPEALEKLVDLAERVANREAAHEFADAMAAFQAECPSIKKTEVARVTSKSGGAYSYQYAPLDEIARTVRPILHRLGLSYSWDSSLTHEGAGIRVVCTLQHVNGHKMAASFEAPTESLSHAMSPQQKVTAALTYARRQSLIQVLGLTTTDKDDDAAAEEPGPTITPEQVDVLEELIGQRPAGSRERLLSWMRAQWNVTSLDDVPASQYEWLVGDLKAKIAKQ